MNPNNFIDKTFWLPLVEEARHARDRCMTCDKPPVVEALWAEGIGRAWFCQPCYDEWYTNGDGTDEVCATKEIEHGIARKHWRDRNSPETLEEGWWGESNTQLETSRLGIILGLS